MILAPIEPPRATECRALLAAQNSAPGVANPAGSLLPFGSFDCLHFARFFIVDDPTVADRALYGLAPPQQLLYLAFQGEIDGDVEQFENELEEKAGPGLRRIFSFCADFDAGTDLRAWMRSHEVPSAVSYVNAPSLTLCEIREEAALAIVVRRQAESPECAQLSAAELHHELHATVLSERTSGRLTQQGPAQRIEWPVIAGVLVAALARLLALAIVFIGIRILELSDPVACPRVSADRALQLSANEDHDVTNQFTAIGSLKPGFVRSITARSILWLVNATTQYVYTGGWLARVQSIQFAHWVLIEGGQRLLFLSNYDGSLASYNDDFINKAAFGLNVVFSNGIGYPRTSCLLFDGAKDEQPFDDYLRRHQLVTDVWYNAHPGLTAVEVWRNHRLRVLLESPVLEARDASEFLGLL
jgi:hypothetical protein